MSEAFVLRSETRRQQVAEHLRREIVSGRRAPGSPLRELELSTSLGVSRGVSYWAGPRWHTYAIG